MMLLMKTLRDLITCSVVFTVFAACAIAFPSSSFNRNERNSELESILDELRKELRINDNSNNFKANDLSFSYSQMQNGIQSNQSPFGTFGKYPSEDLQQHQIYGDDSAIFSEVKRQGSWDFDYGLGGGRFGKRGEELAERARRPADYFSLGGIGGRFGRDTDHVAHMDNDFDDSTDYE